MANVQLTVKRPTGVVGSRKVYFQFYTIIPRLEFGQLSTLKVKKQELLSD